MMKHCHIHHDEKVKMGARRAFTLTELLVVIAIVAILMVLLFSAYNAVISRADAAKCVGNLKIYITNAQMYIADHNGKIPRYAFFDEDLSFNNPRNINWPYQLRDYPNVPSPFQPLCCPASIKSIRKEGLRPYPAGPGANTWSWWHGYNTNRLLSFRSGRNNDTASGSARIIQISTPAKTPFYMDVDLRQSFGSVDAYAGQMSDGVGRSNYKFWAAHHGYFNIAMLDGHVEQVKFNAEGKYKGEAAGDYPQFTWNPLISN